MLLVVDVGNTQTHFGTFKDDELVEHWRFSTVRDSTADELGAALRALLDLRGMDMHDLTASIVSSTVPQLGPEWSAMANRYLSHEMLVVGPGIRSGMALRYDNPREIGADRLVNAVAAYDRIGGACIVVDFGTATTFDYVSPRGEYVGGVIVPGIGISLDALYTRTAKLKPVELVRPPRVVGRNTVHAIQSGVIHGYTALVDGVVEKIRAENDGEARTLATGGLAGLIAPASSTIEAVDEFLTLDGLRLVYGRHMGADTGGRDAS